MSVITEEMRAAASKYTLAGLSRKGIAGKYDDMLTVALREPGPLKPQPCVVDDCVGCFESLARSAHYIPRDDLKLLRELIDAEIANHGPAPPLSILGKAFAVVSALV